MMVNLEIVSNSRLRKPFSKAQSIDKIELRLSNSQAAEESIIKTSSDINK